MRSGRRSGQVACRHLPHTPASAAAFSAITLGCSRLVLRGDGPDASRILFDDPLRARQKAAIALRSLRGSFWDTASTRLRSFDGRTGCFSNHQFVNAGGLAVVTGSWCATRSPPHSAPNTG